MSSLNRNNGEWTNEDDLAAPNTAQASANVGNQRAIQAGRCHGAGAQQLNEAVNRRNAYTRVNNVFVVPTNPPPVPAVKKPDVPITRSHVWRNVPELYVYDSDAHVRPVYDVIAPRVRHFRDAIQQSQSRVVSARR